MALISNRIKVVKHTKRLVQFQKCIKCPQNVLLSSQLKPKLKIDARLGCISLGKILIRILNPKTDFFVSLAKSKKEL